MDIRGSFLVPLLCQIKNLSSINFSTNSISGPIPAGISRCSKLETLLMSTNLLTGTISGEFFSLKRLRRLDLRQNMLSGGIPTQLLAYSLETLDLSSNRLNGSIPEEISNLYGLVHLDLSANSFSGPIPAAFSHLHRLSKLSLAFNNLNGTIPVEFEQQLHLKDIDVSHNQLSGDIWETFYALRANLTLSICSNHLSGRIPENLVNNRFPNACFDPENLCSSVPTLGLPRCESDNCSDYAFQGQKSCKSMPSKRKKIIITCSAIAGAVIGVVILLAVFRLGMERRTVNDKNDDVSMISYQRLKFNKWEVLAGLIDENLVGNGGSAKVYKVMTKRGKSLAVKSIRHQVLQGHMLEKQFLAEVKILGGIRHNNIVKLLCCITGNTTKLIVYEYMDKECLHKWLHGKRNQSMSVESSTQWERRLKIAIGASQGLCHMHHHCHPPIVHRDIKSSNILVDSEFNAKIADFGLAKMLASQGDPVGMPPQVCLPYLDIQSMGEQEK
ncbi:unnamed protein product [Cuscuta campestris]|uniref:Protein kinase domain-containing protein n=1 Tax=Cuscuta campestris TaxID=132261 RepID=A0A484N149_9ASTE|nr:unnamed protein product [Cuscuta campestris]